MKLLVDGHNLIGQMPDISLADPDDEVQLVARLRAYAARTGHQVTVIFDGGAPGYPAAGLTGGRVTVRFAPPGRPADALIVRRIRQIRDRSGWLVVTSDRAILTAATQHRVRTKASEAFVTELQAAPPQSPAPDPRQVPPARPRWRPGCASLPAGSRVGAQIRLPLPQGGCVRLLMVQLASNFGRPMLAVLVGCALVFDFLNGFHDSSNIVATVIASRAMSPRVALLTTAVAHLIGPFLFGVAVAKTIGEGLVDPAHVTMPVVIATLLAAIAWNLVTWWLGIPSSSSHALVGGIMGAVIVSEGINAIESAGLIKVGVALFASPVIGLVGGYLLMHLTLFLARGARPGVNRFFKQAQILTSISLALSHGANDAQKTMGMITLGLVVEGAIPTFEVPPWVVLISAAAIALGTATGGWRLIKTLGARIYKIRPVHGFVSQITGASVILGAALLGGPVSTTQVMSSAIMGVGSAERLSKVRWQVGYEMMIAWVLDDPGLWPAGCRGLLSAIDSAGWIEMDWLKRFFKPRQSNFLKLLIQQGEHAISAAEALQAYLAKPSAKNVARARQVEKDADEIRRILIDELNQTFVTPIDREDIFALSRAIDDLIDYLYNTVEEMEVLGVEPDDSLVELSSLLLDAANEIHLAMQRLEDHPGVANEHAMRAKALENRVERVYRRNIAELFQGPESVEHVMDMLKHREVLRHLSNAADQGDQAADIITDIVVKQT